MSNSNPFSIEEQENFEFGITEVIEQYALIALRANDKSSDFYDSDNVDRDQRNAETDIKKRAKISAKIIGEIYYHYQRKGIDLEEEELNNELIPHAWTQSKLIYSNQIELKEAVKRYINDRDKK